MIDDAGVTMSDYRQLLELNCKCFAELQKNQQIKSQTPEDYREKRGEMLVGEMVNSYLIDREARKRGLEAPLAEVERARDEFVRRFPACGTNAVDVFRSLGVDESFMMRMHEQDVRREMLLCAECPGITNVATADIQMAKDKLAKFRADAAGSNAVQRARLEAALAEIRSGGDFVAVGRKYEPVQEPLSEGAKSPAEEWGEFEKSDLECEGEALQKWAFSAKPGDVAGPFEVQDGLSIVKLLEVSEGTEDDSMASAKVKTVRLARINLEAYAAVETPDDATLIVWIKDLNRRTTLQRLLDDLRGKARIVINIDKEDRK